MSTPSTSCELAVALTTHNSMRTIERTLESVKGLAAKVVVVDSGSTDRTVECCRSFGANVIHRDWAGHVAQKQFALDQCRDLEWTLLLDSDESLEPLLQDSICEVLKRDDPAFDGWMVNRKIWFLGGWLHHMYQPEWRLRLFRSANARVEGIDPHDRIEVSGNVGKLSGDLRHDSWADLGDLAHRQIVYAKKAAEGYPKGGSVFNMIVNPPASMFKQLVLKRGFLDGWRGLIAAGMTANATMLKHSFIAAKRFAHREGSPP